MEATFQESDPNEKARFCGHSDETIQWMINGARESGLSREELARMWEDTYPDRDALETARELCGPCVEAVVKLARQVGESLGKGGP